MLDSDRTGRERFWELQTMRLAQTRHFPDEISDQWDCRLERLRAIVEGAGNRTLSTLNDPGQGRRRARSETARAGRRRARVRR
jgi:hypothetical protein